MTRAFAVEMTTMCLIRNAKNELLIQERKKSDWPGWTFPGGHVEKGESLTDCVIREVKEETGLVIQPKLMGIAEWLNGEEGEREICGLFCGETTADFQGEELFWLPESNLIPEKLAGTLGDLIPIFLGQKQAAFFSPKLTIY